MTRISESEMKLMKIIWDYGGELTTAEILKRLDNSWKHTTTLTFLKRLTDKGILSVKRHGKTNCYSALVSEEEYKKAQTKEFLDDFYSGSVGKFLTAFYGNKKPSKKDMEEIKRWFEEV